MTESPVSPQPSLFWFACDEPERPPDAFVMWHWWHCPICALKAHVQTVRFPDDDAVQRVLGPLARSLEEYAL